MPAGLNTRYRAVSKESLLWVRVRALNRLAIRRRRGNNRRSFLWFHNTALRGPSTLPTWRSLRQTGPYGSLTGGSKTGWGAHFRGLVAAKTAQAGAALGRGDFLRPQPGRVWFCPGAVWFVAHTVLGVRLVHLLGGQGPIVCCVLGNIAWGFAHVQSLAPPTESLASRTSALLPLLSLPADVDRAALWSP